ncbi:MAG: hypothetical protein JO048_01055 [Methylobacteriaceae bacterium]|nr:hypothetical protein [Methylobacteriaceae bacterium]
MDQRDRQNLAVAIVVIILIAGGYWLTTVLHRNAQLEDCLMQRRRNCEQLVH